MAKDSKEVMKELEEMASMTDTIFDEDEEELDETEESEDEEDESEESEDEEQDDDEPEDDEGEDADDDDSEEDEESEAEEDEAYSEKDLKKLSEFPKDVRGAIAKLPKAEKSKLIAWVATQNEDKRRIAADAKAEKEEAAKTFKESDDIKNACGEMWQKVADKLKANSGRLQPEDRAAIEKMLEAQEDAIKTSFDARMKSYMLRQSETVTPEIFQVLKNMGYKPEAWLTKHQDEANILYMSTMFMPPEKRKTVLKRLTHIIEQAGKATTRKKTRPRPAGGSQRQSVSRDKAAYLALEELASPNVKKRK